MAEKRRIRPGQIPDWRPGAVYWKPLADGREVTIYPLLHGKARLCVGPLADPNGYDIAYRYPDVNSAEEAARAWDGESKEHPGLFEEIEFQPKVHPGKVGDLAIHSSALMPKTKLELTDTFMVKAEVLERRESADPEATFYDIELRTEDGKFAEIKAVRRPGDPTGSNGKPIITILSAQIHGAIPSGQTHRPDPHHQRHMQMLGNDAPIGVWPQPWSKEDWGM